MVAERRVEERRALHPVGAVDARALVREEGVIVRGIRDLVALAPPLVATHEEVDRIFAAVEKGLDRLWG